MTSASAQEELEAEFQQLKVDRETLRSIFPAGINRVLLLYFHSAMSVIFVL